MTKSINNQLLGGDFNRTDFFNSVQKYLKAGFWYWDGSSNRLYFGKKISLAMGIEHPADGISIDEFKKVIHADDRKTVDKVFSQLFKKQKSVSSFEIRLKYNDDWRWIRSSALMAEVDPNMNVTLVVGRISEVDVSKYRKGSNTIDEFKNFASFCYDVDSHKIDWNSSPYKVLEMHESDIPLNLIMFKSILPYEVFASFETKWASFCSGSNKNFVFDFNITDSKGEVKNFAIYASKSTTGNGNTINGLLQDRLNVPNELREYDRFLINYNTYINQIQIPIIIHNSSSSVTYVNKVFAKMFGYQADELLAGNGFRQIFVSDADRDKYQEFITSKTKPLTIQIKSKTGEIYTIRWTLSPQVGDEILVYGVDLTPLVKEQNMAKRFQQRLNFYTNQMPQLMACKTQAEFDSTLGTIFTSQFPKYIGIPYTLDASDGFITLNSMIGLNAKRNAEFIDILGWNPKGRRFLKAGDSSDLFSACAPTRVGENFSQFTEGFLLVSSAKSVEKFLGISDIYRYRYRCSNNLFGGMIILKSVDCSEFNFDIAADLSSISALAQIRILHDNDIAAAGVQNTKSRNYKQIIGNVGREIIAPSNSIIGYVQLLQNQNIDEEQREQYLVSIKNAGQQLLWYANDLCDLLKIAEGKLTLVKSNVDLKKVLNNVADTARLFVDSNKLDLVRILVSFHDNANDFTFQSDEGRIEQILERLLNNILSFTERGTISLEYKMLSDSVELRVISQNIDIDPTMYDIILDKYRNIDSSESNASLLLANKLILLLGGTFNIDLSLRPEVSFVLKFPVSSNDETLDVEPVSSTPTLSYNLKNKVVLIAEDEFVNYRLLQIMLESWGAKTLWAKNGREAVNLVDSMGSNINLIFMDIRMPEMDGYAATMEIKQLNSSIPVIAQTAFSEVEDRLKAESAGCDGYIAKPIEVSKLLDLLERYC